MQRLRLAWHHRQWFLSLCRHTELPQAGSAGLHCSSRAAGGWEGIMLGYQNPVTTQAVLERQRQHRAYSDTSFLVSQSVHHGIQHKARSTQRLTEKWRVPCPVLKLMKTCSSWELQVSENTAAEFSCQHLYKISGRRCAKFHYDVEILIITVTKERWCLQTR